MNLSKLLATMICISIFASSLLPKAALAEIAPPDSRGECDSRINTSIDNLVQAAAVEKNMPGLTVAVTRNGELVCNKGYGYANWDEKTPMQPETRSQIGSTTKVLAALSMMKLIEDEANIGLITNVYGSNGILNGSEYRDAYVQGTRRHHPLVGLAIGNNNRVLAWYSDGMYTIGNSSDLDKHAGPEEFSLPTDKAMTDLLAIARGGPDNKVYSWYRGGDDTVQYSIGTPSDLDAYSTSTESFKIPNSQKKNTIVGIAVNTTGDAFYAYYHDGTVSSGSTPGNLKDRWVKEYTVPGDWQRRYDIVDVARSANGNTLAWYSDDKASKGNATNLSAHTALYDFSRRSIPGSRSDWNAEYEKMQIRHLLSHTSGFSRSGDAAQGSVKYGFEDSASNHDNAIDPIPYKYSNQYVLSTRPLLFEVGTGSSYSNHGMGLVGHLIEETSGQDWYDYMYSNILEPAGATHIVPRGMFVDPALDANPHSLSDGQIQTQAMEASSHSGSTAGSLKASAADLARVMLATDHLPNHPDVLDSSTIAIMESRPFPSVAAGRAHGWQVKCRTEVCSDYRRLWHNGASSGGTSFIAKYQNFTINETTVDGINVAIVVNRSGAGTNRLARLANDIAVETATNINPNSFTGESFPTSVLAYLPFVAGQ